MEKSVPRDHRLSSLGKPLDAERQFSGRIFYHTVTLVQQPDAQWFESGRDKYLFFRNFLFFVIFPANFKKHIRMQNLIKLYGAVREL